MKLSDVSLPQSAAGHEGVFVLQDGAWQREKDGIHSRMGNQ